MESRALPTGGGGWWSQPWRSSPGTLVQARFPGTHGVTSPHLQSLERDTLLRLSTHSTREAHDLGVPPAYRRRTPDRFRQRRVASARIRQRTVELTVKTP